MRIFRSTAIALCILCNLLIPAHAVDHPSTASTQYLDVKGGRIAFDDTGGPGPLLIAVPGMGDLRGQYRYLRPLLKAAGYRVVTMDVRGLGESSAQWADYSAHAVGNDVLALMTHLGAQSAVVVGNSFAAGSALWAEHDAPGRIRGVILLAPIVRDQPQSAWIDAIVKAGFAGPWRVWFWTTYWNSLFPASKPADHEQYRAALSRNLHEPGRMAALEKMVWLSKSDTEAILGTRQVPTLIVMGTKDADFDNPRAEAQFLASQLNAELMIVEGAGHYPHIEMADAVAQRVIRFLQQSGVR